MPVTKKWETTAELDLCMAVILTGGSSTSYKWPEIHQIMNQLGHGFTKDAISQHFTKVILKNFKNRHGLPAGKLEGISDTGKGKGQDKGKGKGKREAEVDDEEVKSRKRVKQ